MSFQQEEIRYFRPRLDWEILVGKTAKANEILSLKVGKPADFWFHIAGQSGSHVIARHPDRPVRCPRDIKRLAAGLAAFFSKAKNAKKVSVHFTTCKFVSKKKGTSLGQVHLKAFEVVQIYPIDPQSI